MTLFIGWDLTSQQAFNTFYQSTVNTDQHGFGKTIKYTFFHFLCEWFADFVYSGDTLDSLVADRKERFTDFEKFQIPIKNLQSTQDALNIPDQIEARLEVIYKYITDIHNEFKMIGTATTPTGSVLPNFDSLTKVDFTSFASELDVTNQDLSVIHFLFKSGLVKPTLLISEAVQNGLIKIEVDKSGYKKVTFNMSPTSARMKAIKTLKPPILNLIFSLAQTWSTDKIRLLMVTQALKETKKHTTEKNMLPWDFLSQPIFKIGSFIALVVLGLLAFVVKMYVI